MKKTPSRINEKDKSVEDKRGGIEEKRSFMLDKLKLSGLTAKDAALLGYKEYTAEQSVSLNLQRTGSGFILPYCTYEGKPLSMFRYRYEHTTIQTGLGKGGKLRKYDQPADTDPEIYFPRLIDWRPIVTDPLKPIVITEGELKAACGVKHGFAVIGVGGVYSFGRRARHQAMLPALQAIKWKDRPVYITYDSDAVTNPKVMVAENRLARVLTDHGAVVYIARLPMQGDEKVGLDDYLVAHGAKALQALFDATEGWAESEELHKINSEAVFIADPSMVVLFPKEGKKHYITHGVNAFVHEVYANRHMFVVNENTGKQVRKSAAAEWVKWPNRNELEGIAYEPGKPAVYGNKLNMWQGWGVEPVAGCVLPWLRLLDHVFASDVESRHWFQQWLAYPMQHPGVKLKTACVFWSVDQGTGKSIIGYTVGRIYGDNFSEVNKPDLARSFNGWAANKQFIMGEEITGGSGRDMADVLKNMITGTDIQVNIKYKPSYALRNSLNYYFTSNHQDAFFMNDKDRRYFVHEMPPTPPREFWNEYDKWYKSDAGTAALFDYLLRYDITGFNPNAEAPHTRSRNDMIESNLSEMQGWVAELREHPDNLLRAGSAVLGWTLATTQDLLTLYAPEGSDRRNKSERAMAIALKEFGFKRVSKGEAIDVGGGIRKRGVWAVRNPADANLSQGAAGERYRTERKLKLSAGAPKHAGKGK